MSHVVKGTIDCKDTKELPVGSVVFIYVYKNESDVIGHQTLQSVEHFPFEYNVEIDEKSWSENANYSIRVTVENGEKTLYLNGKAGLTTLTKAELTNKPLDITLNAYPISA